MSTFLEELALWTRVSLACPPDGDVFHLTTPEGQAVCGAWEVDPATDLTAGVLADVDCPECLELLATLPDRPQPKADLWSKKIGTFETKYPGLSGALTKSEQLLKGKSRQLSQGQFDFAASGTSRPPASVAEDPDRES